MTEEEVRLIVEALAEIDHTLYMMGIGLGVLLCGIMLVLAFRRGR